MVSIIKELSNYLQNLIRNRSLAPSIHQSNQSRLLVRDARSLPPLTDTASQINLTGKFRAYARSVASYYWLLLYVVLNVTSTLLLFSNELDMK